MPVTVNNRSVAHKGTTGIAIAFPDVCKTPAPIVGMVPIPYPNIAKTAAAKQKKTAGGASTKVGSKVPMSSGDQAGTVSGIVSAKNMGKASFKTAASKVTVEGARSVHATAMTAHNAAAKKTETQQLRARLGSLNAKLQSMVSNDPAHWQAVLQEYAVVASALYVTLNDDD